MLWLVDKNRGGITMTTIKIADICGPICVDAADGVSICDRVGTVLARGHSVCLDFTGVTAITTAFLNASVGCLHGRFEINDLRKRLTTHGLDKSDADLLDLVRRSAGKYFHSSDETREVIDEAAHAPLATC